MISHAPADYQCPICLAISGVEHDATLLKQTDLVYQDDLVSVFINAFFIEGNEGHVIIVPHQHFESLYDLPPIYGHRIFEVSQKIALTLKEAYACDGITIRQNNEPAAGQHAFHYHMHIFPRYENDHFEENAQHKRATTPEERLAYTQKIRNVDNITNPKATIINRRQTH